MSEISWIFQDPLKAANASKYFRPALRPERYAGQSLSIPATGGLGAWRLPDGSDVPRAANLSERAGADELQQRQSYSRASVSDHAGWHGSHHAACAGWLARHQ